MATGDDPKWPGPVTFDDQRPKDGYCTVHLKIPGMKTGGIFGGGAPKNADIKQASIESDRVIVQIVCDGAEYLYNKQLPEDVNESKSKVKYKNDRVMIELCKSKPTSWGGHYQHMIKKE